MVRSASISSTRAERLSTSSILASTARIAGLADGTRQVAKFDAPKATLMSYIIKGILNRELPWGLVLLGVDDRARARDVRRRRRSRSRSACICRCRRRARSSSAAWSAGSAICYVRKKHARPAPDGGTADGRRRQEPGRAAGLGLHRGRRDRRHRHRVHGRASCADFTERITAWSTANNPFFEGPSANLLSLIPFAVLVVLLLLVGREVVMAPRGDHGN